MPEEQLERSVLDGKDREQLHAIAGAMGVRAATRMKKADLIDAILDAANGNGGEAAGSSSDGRGDGKAKGAAKPRRVRSTKTAGDDDPIAALAAEEESLASSSDGDDTDVEPSPRQGRGAAKASGGSAGADDASGTATATRARVDEEDARQSYGEGNRRRRRRRGRGDRQSDDAEPQGEPEPAQGLLDLRDEGYGFLRATGYLAGPKDVYVSASQVKRFSLRKGDFVTGMTRPAARTEKYPALLRVDQINGMSPDDARARPRFEDLTPLFPDSKLRLELDDDPLNMTGRIVDLISPIGKGQRGLIVSPPKAGKTTILKQLVYSVERNNPEVHLMVLLVDERPEEVTDMRRHVLKGEVVASTFDRPSDEHTQVAELTIERAKRLVEMGHDVVIVLDGITRLARAYNLSAPASGRILSGGVDSTALYPPKRFFGAARNIEEGGSLTIIATALIETGSRMDEVIFEEFKGTGNMELRLDRRLSERRIYPSIDVEASSTRHEELLFDRTALQQVWKLRRVLNALEDGKGLELLMDKIRTTKSNDEFLAEIAKAPTPGS
jgi:transcription termination factor Rho